MLARHRGCAAQPVRFLTGTDENALKNVTAAARGGRSRRRRSSPRTPTGSPALREPLTLSFDDFIRTSSDPRHVRGVERLWRRSAAPATSTGARYEGLYCVGCEQFYDPG